MKLIIAEKPSLAKAIADGFDGKQIRKDGFIEVEGYTVTWCIGHLLELYMPEDYDEQYKNWSKVDLPFIPDGWKYKAGKGKSKQLSIVKKLIGQSSYLVNAGDPDREGSFLVDIVVSFCGGKSKPCGRLLVSDMNKPAVKRAIKKMAKDNITKDLSNSALARQRADYLYGLNMTMAYTLKAKDMGYSGVISIGRVQTPVLGLIVRRSQEISNFVPHDFYTIKAKFKTAAGEYDGEYKPTGDGDDYDNNSRLINENVVNEIVSKLDNGAKAKIVCVDNKETKSKSPLPFSLSALQKEANKKYGYTANEVLDAAQWLYETAKATTYPRSDCDYLPEDHHSEAETILKSISSSSLQIAQHAINAEPDLKHSAFNDSKITAHHAIVPTGNIDNLKEASKKQLAIYELIASRYVALFHPSAIDAKTKITTLINDIEFITKGSVEIIRGFRDVLSITSNIKPLPKVEVGDAKTMSINSSKSTTTPPSLFTDGTLLDAMTGISRFVKDQSFSKLLKETDGLGTEATRGGIIENIVKRGYVVRQKKAFIPTELGIQLINQLPEKVTYPDTTAAWEKQLDEISKGNQSPLEFMSNIINEFTPLIKNPELSDMSNIKKAGQIDCPNCEGELKRIPKRDKSYFWVCNRNCGYLTNDSRGKPAKKVEASDKYFCPKCEKPMIKRKGSNGNFWACTGFKEGCSYTAKDHRNKPVLVEEKKLPELSDKPCPECSKPLAIRNSKNGQFLGCTGYPSCKHSENIK